jgi:hypothetical protein
MHASFLRHGVFTNNATATLERFKNAAGRVEGVIKAFRDMGITSVWVRLFGVSGNVAHKPALELVSGLKEAKFNLAGWGYCFGADWKNDLKSSIDQCERYGLDAYVADIEPGNKTKKGVTVWEESDFDKLMKGLAGHFGPENLGVSTWPVLKIQDKHKAVALMKLAEPRVAMFAPQAYWMTFPKKVHYNATGFEPKDYPPNDPASFVRLVVDSWRALGIVRPLVVTGQAYWGERGPGQPQMEIKLMTFLDKFPDWGKLIGFNWWHAGGKGAAAMSPKMVDAIANADLESKPYAVV